MAKKKKQLSMKERWEKDAKLELAFTVVKKKKPKKGGK